MLELLGFPPAVLPVVTTRHSRHNLQRKFHLRSIHVKRHEKSFAQKVDDGSVRNALKDHSRQKLVAIAILPMRPGCEIQRGVNNRCEDVFFRDFVRLPFCMDFGVSIIRNASDVVHHLSNRYVFPARR